jgi:hypothetical protein
VQYAVTGPTVVEAIATSFSVQVWAMITSTMHLFKRALELSSDTEKRHAFAVEPLEPTVMDFEVTVIVTGCTVGGLGV